MYIERGDLINYVEDLPIWGTDGDMLDRQDVIGSIENFHSADVAPVRHGRWIVVKVPNEWDKGQCSECKSIFNSSVWGTKYCPNCGAKMDLP